MSEAVEYASFAFFKLDRSWRLLAQAERDQLTKEFAQAAQASGGLTVHTYCTVGTRSEADFVLWVRANSPEAIQAHLIKLLKSRMAGYLHNPHTFFGMTRPSPYTGGSSAASARGTSDYLVVYPFTKSHEWYQLPLGERKKLMAEHIGVAEQFRDIKQVLYYSYGVSDNEFVAVYEVHSLPRFQDLVMKLREVKVRPYTMKDTPTFACIRSDFGRLFEMLA